MDNEIHKSIGTIDIKFQLAERRSIDTAKFRLKQVKVIANSRRSNALVWLQSNGWRSAKQIIGGSPAKFNSDAADSFDRRILKANIDDPQAQWLLRMYAEIMINEVIVIPASR